ITVKTDCDLSAHMTSISASLEQKPEDRDAMIDFFKRNGFKTWLRELTEQTADDAPAVAGAAQGGLFDAVAEEIEQHYETILSESDFERWLEKIDHAELTALDTETTSLDSMQAQLVGISISCEPGTAAYIPVAHTYQDAPQQLSRDYVLEKMRAWLESPDKLKLGQNLKYDSHVFANHGITLRGIAHDTLLQSYVFESHRNHDMDNLALRHLNRKTITFQDVCGKGASQLCFDQVELARATEYAAED